MSVTDPAQTDLGYTDPDPLRSGPWSRVQMVVLPLAAVLLAFSIGGILIWLQGLIR